MLLEPGRSTRGLIQIAYGYYLLLFTLTGMDMGGPLRAAARYAHLSRSGTGPYSGVVRVGRHTFPIVGDYGNDGLPLFASADLWPLLLPIPGPLQRGFWTGHLHTPPVQLRALTTWAASELADLRVAGTGRAFPHPPTYTEQEITDEADARRRRGLEQGEKVQRDPGAAGAGDDPEG